jgi:diaminohydroxyphosphoribosylaminopyrimidine deaminase/5-amino-6-(5-phosphoribosylamino)uracil reductase
MMMAIRLARKGMGWTSPNPMVGAVIVKDGEVVGKGYHRMAGEEHAEVMALREAGKRAKGGRIFVNLEPCNHYGKTPPCTHAIVAGGIKECIVGMVDPNPNVKGGGIDFLRENGVHVIKGVLEERCKRLNEAFIKYVTTGRPFVTIKVASTLDGKIATRNGDSRWITGEAARRASHILRHSFDAIMVGIGTVIADDPQLTTRIPGKRGKNPIRVILDTNLRIPLTAKCLDTSSGAKTIIVTSHKAPRDKVILLENRGVEVIFSNTTERGIDLNYLMETLGKRGITSILIEGGGRLNSSAIREGICDKIIAFYAPKMIGGWDAPGMFSDLGINKIADAIEVQCLKIRRYGEDFAIEGYLLRENNKGLNKSKILGY